MFLSTFEIFKIGIGPSSSHTMGPMTAASHFIKALCHEHTGAAGPASVARVSVTLHGSLAYTGKGHATDKAVCLGLLGEIPAQLDPDNADRDVAALRTGRMLQPRPGWAIQFDPHTDIVFDFGPPLAAHANGLVFRAWDSAGAIVRTCSYYSIGGGFVVDENGAACEQEGAVKSGDLDFPFDFANAADLLLLGKAHQATIAEMMRANEVVLKNDAQLDRDLDGLWQVMKHCIDRGLHQDGILPGGLKVKRRAASLWRQLRAERDRPGRQPLSATDWLLAYAMAVNEENAAGSRIVTAPTNGAAGVVPAVLCYYSCHCPDATQGGIRDFLLTAAAIGGIIKHNASISGAELGCQGEVGSASAMAAAGLCAALGGSNEQVENAAEIALEHHLGMTCDPVAGLVQIPCIERNGMGAAKAVSACSLALRGDGMHLMPLDNCIAAMRATGLDMSDKYKETSLGGLAVNLPEC